MTDYFQDLAETIHHASQGKKIIYIPNPGNYGDGLIRYGTKYFLANKGISHFEMNIGLSGGKLLLLPFLTRSNFFFLYGGGGAWCKAYDFGLRNVSFIDRFTKNYLVMPSTYELPVSKLRGTLYRRDQGESRTVAPNATFCHDMALFLTTLKLPYHSGTGTREGNFFRTDRESARGGDLPQDNLDLSGLGDHMSNGDAFLSKLADYQVINTDRLHVAIAGALVGARVNLHAGNYFKIREIYRASLHEIFGDRINFQG